jgi:hypothetical protein
LSWPTCQQCAAHRSRNRQVIPDQGLFE